MNIQESDIHRLVSHIISDYNDPEICWETDLVHEKGYPYFQLNGKQRASRIAYEIAKGSIPPDMMVLHNCNNRKCINPSHLYLGNHRQNMIDRDLSNRTAKGETNGFSKLTESDIVIMFQMIEDGKFISILQVADYYEVTREEIEAILNGKLWSYFTSTLPYDLQNIKSKISNNYIRQQLRNAQIGENSPHHKLCRDDVIEIKRLLCLGVPCLQISKKFNVSRPTITLIRNGKTWSHV